MITYYSNNPLKDKNLLGIYKTLILDVVKNHELIWRLFYRDFSARYKQSAIGLLWVFIMPFVSMGTFFLLHLSGVINIGNISVPYPIYGLLSIALWNIFSTGLSNSTGDLEALRNVISRVNVSKTAILFASFCQVIVDFSARLLILSLVFLLYRKLPPIYFIFFPLYILPIFFLTYSFSFLTSILQVLIKDTNQFVTVFLNLSLLLMPIMYTLPKIGVLAKVNYYNPILYIITTPRDIILYGKTSHPLEYLLSCLFVFFLFLINWLFFYKSVPRIIEKI